MRLKTSEMAGLVFIATLLGGLALAGLAFLAIGNFAALLIIVGLIGFAGYFGLRRVRPSSVEIRGSDDGVHRILVVAHEGLGGSVLIDALDHHSATGEECAIHIVVPALSSRSHRISSDLDTEHAAAASDLERLLGEVRPAGIAASGEVGDGEPRLALEDALRGFAADAVLIVNPQPELIGPQEAEATRRAVEDAPVPVTVLNV